MTRVTGVTTDYVGGDNACHNLATTVWKGFITKTAAYTLTSADSGRYVICSGGSWALTLPAPAAGLVFQLRNDMGISGTTGTITLTPTGGTIDGAASLALLPQQDCTLLTDGVNWRTLGLKREVILGTVNISSATASGVVLLPVGYRLFMFDITGLIGDTASTNPTFVLSNNGGASFDTAANYRESLIYDSTASAVAYLWTAGQSFGTFAWYTDLGSASTLKIYPGTAGVAAPTWQAQAFGYRTSNSRIQVGIISGYWNGAGPANALRWNQSSGNLTSMFLTVKGVV
jgi:hypothetical protein